MMSCQHPACYIWKQPGKVLIMKYDKKGHAIPIRIDFSLAETTWRGSSYSETQEKKSSRRREGPIHNGHVKHQQLVPWIELISNSSTSWGRRKWNNNENQAVLNVRHKRASWTLAHPVNIDLSFYSLSPHLFWDKELKGKFIPMLDPLELQTRQVIKLLEGFLKQCFRTCFP